MIILSFDLDVYSRVDVICCEHFLILGKPNEILQRRKKGFGRSGVAAQSIRSLDGVQL